MKTNKNKKADNLTGLMMALKPIASVKGRNFKRLGDILTYTEYIRLENALIKTDFRIIISMMSKVTGLNKFTFKRLNPVVFMGVAKHIAEVCRNVEEYFYKSSKPQSMTGAETGCGFEELNEKYRHEMRLCAAAEQAKCTVFEMKEKSISEVLRWYGLNKAEQSAMAKYTKNLQKK